jgi:hypothetical protein
MLFKIDVTNSAGATYTFQLDDPSSGFELREVQGLDPVKATIVTTSFAQLDGTQYQSSKREARDILIRLGLEPDFVGTSVKDLRKILYNWFMPKTFVSITLYDDDEEEPTVYITGRVESNQAPLFQQFPEANLSIMCFDSDFKDLGSVSISGNSVSDTTETLVEYTGTVETGIVFTFSPDRDISEFTLYHRTPDGTTKQSNFAVELHAGDVVTLSTSPGSKSVILTRSGSDTSILYGMPAPRYWIALAPGDNYIRVFAEGDGIPFEIAYTNRYGGL